MHPSCGRAEWWWVWRLGGDRGGGFLKHLGIPGDRAGRLLAVGNRRHVDRVEKRAVCPVQSDFPAIPPQTESNA